MWNDEETVVMFSGVMGLSGKTPTAEAADQLCLKFSRCNLFDKGVSNSHFDH